MLHIATPFAAFEEKLLLVSDSVSIGVAVGKDVEGVRFLNEEPVVEWQDLPGEEKVVDKYRVFVHLAITIGVFVKGYAASGFLFTSGIGILHVGAHFGDEHSTIAVESADDGFFDNGITDNEFKMIAFRELKRFQAFLKGEHRNVIYLWKFGIRIGSATERGGAEDAD
jgi:hypothetical protein